MGISTTYNLDDIGIVVPTLGQRHEYLNLSLLSLRKSGCKNILLVCPEDCKISSIITESLYDQIIFDPMLGLPSAINYGVVNFGPDVKLIGWLADDDLLEPESLAISTKVFNSNPEIVAVYGNCILIDEFGNYLYTMRPKKFSLKFAHFLPNLIPQPGSIIRRDVFTEIGMLSNKYPLAFDFEMFLRLRRKGCVQYINKSLSKFRRHASSLSVKQRKLATKQASKIRRENLHPNLKNISFLWEWFIKLITNLAGKFFDIKSTIRKK